MVSTLTVAEGDEVELKLLAIDGRPLEALAARQTLGPARLGAVRVSDEMDRYLDTADGRLSAARWACRLRTRGGRTIVSLKGPSRSTGDDAALHQRPEREGPAEDRLDPASWPPSEARDLLLELSADRPLVERLALRQERSERAVQAGGTRVGTLSLDRVDVLRRGEGVGRLFVVELELAGDAARDASLIGELSSALATVPGLSADPSSKLEHALALVAGAPAASASSPLT